VDAVVEESIKTAGFEEGQAVDEAEFKKSLTEILRAIMLRLNDSPVFVSTDVVVHEPLSGTSSSVN
jgi:hypothetical protein